MSPTLWEQVPSSGVTVQDGKGQLSRRSELLEIAGAVMAPRTPSGKHGEGKT